MKPSLFLAIAVAAFVTAAAFRAALPPVTENTLRAFPPPPIKPTVIGCSPLYEPTAEDDIPPLPGWGNYQWKITTGNDSAQYYFNQGINMYYAFHIIEARASFHKATRFDPDCAMVWYGKALAYGPNINDFVYQQPDGAFPSAQKAYELRHGGTDIEQALIEVMASRYSEDSAQDQVELNEQYAASMARLYTRFPNNDNVSTLYADALMLLHPWDFYNHDFTPKAWTPQLVGVLQHALKLNPKHPGAHHLYIHAVEASAQPDIALSSAHYLAHAMPGVAHVTHMPSHIYIRTGYYSKGIDVNNHALKAFETYLQAFPPTAENVPLYQLHNLHMKASCAMLAGNYANAHSAAEELQQAIPPFFITIGGALGDYVQYLHQTPLFVKARFGCWKELADQSIDDTLSNAPVLQLYARGVARAKTGNLAGAQADLANMKTKMENTPSLKEPFTPYDGAYEPAVVAMHLLEGAIAEGKTDYPGAIKFYSAAVEQEDKLIYNEPRSWLLPARQYLGDALLKAGRYKEAANVFKKDLAINPNNGWALTGLEMCYKAQRNKPLAAAVGRRLRTAWMIKDVPVERAVF